MANGNLPALKSRGARAIGWGLAGSAVKFLLAIGVQATLARLLGPAQFGIFALGLVMLGIASFFADVGLATRLVQRPVVDDTAIGFVVTWNLALSSGVAAAVYVLSSSIASAIAQPETEMVFRVLALVLVINALSAVSIALLRRNLDYRTIQICEILGYLVGFAGVGIAAASSRFAAYALVSAFVSQALVTSLLLYAHTRHSLRPRLMTADAATFANFGIAIVATNLVNWYVQSIDKILIGRVHTQTDLGLYTTVQNLMNSPANMLYPNVQSVVFSTTARLQDDMRALARTYEVLLATVLTVVVPLFIGVAVVADALVITVYGAKWTAAGVIAPALTVAAPCILVWGISTPMLWNSDRKLTEVQVQSVFAVVMTALLAWAVTGPVAVVAWTVLALAVGRTTVIAVAVLRRLETPRDTLKTIAANALVSIACVAVASVAMRLAMGWLHVPAWLLAMAGVTATLCALLGTLLARPALLPRAARDMLRGPAGRLPGVIQSLLGRLWA